jgi:hypothetical protein
MSNDFMSVLQDLIPEVIPSQKCHMNIGLILNSYGAMDIWNLRWSEPYVEHQGHSCVLQHWKFDDVEPLFCLLCVHTPCFSCNPTQSPQWPTLCTTTTNPLIRILLIQVLHYVSAEIWGALYTEKYICNLVLWHLNHI